ncbi:MAG TPA: hypothetical protein VNO26_03305 [Candidatus Limnocylindria bacterium]|nr:hypothetical protein [Candidatus Limnocylindria bacterium]
MVRIRYTAWDGTQRPRPTAEQVFDRYGELLGLTDDARHALEWLLREGFDWDGGHATGLDELLARLRERLRERQRDVHLNDALSAIRERLDELLARERAALANEPDAAERLAALAELPGRLSEALARLCKLGLVDPDARAALEELLEALDDIRDLEDFVREFGSLFTGTEALSFEEAVALMREMERWRALEAALAAGDLDTVDADLLGELVGADARQALVFLREAVRLLWEGGFFTTRGERVHLSPKGARRIGQLALREIYQRLVRDRAGGHQTDHRGAVEIRPNETRPYRHGDVLALDLVGTLKKALARRPGTPLVLAPDDFEVYAADHATTTSTVLLLDMSWSMSWEGRFAAAKRVALALETLIRTRFPRDYFGVVGFYTRAVELKLSELPEASWNMGDPFTNLQDGLRLGARLLARHPARNRHMIIVTDGQPTAYFQSGRLQCEWPLSFGGISLRAANETLREVERVTRQGIVINTFMLDDSPSLRAFVERLTRINKGRALYTSPERLGEYLLVDYVGKKRKRV